MCRTLVYLTITILLASNVLAETTTARIEFVGCASDGQVGPVDAPEGDARIVTFKDDIQAQDISYYKARGGSGVYAPSGWKCRAWYGSSGTTLIVTPDLIQPPYFPVPKFHGSAIEMTEVFGGTSGRFSVAILASRIFSVAAANLIEKVKAEEMVPNSKFESGPHKYDALRYLNNLTVEFTTPAEKEGLGTEGFLSPSKNAIRGVVVLDQSDPEWPNVSIVSVRLPTELIRLEAEILRLYTACMQLETGC